MRAFVTLVVALCLAPAPVDAAGTITTANVATLALRWELTSDAAFTAGPVLANGLLYAPSWDRNVYALDPATGAVVWAFPTGAVIGVIGAVLPTPDGMVCFGDSNAHVWCLDGLSGAVVWDRAVGQPGLDAVWSPLATAQGRLFVSIASLADAPCTKGRLVALDLATGNPLWQRQTVPDNVCDSDTAIECTDDTPCGGGTCIPARGAGVTATVSFDPSGSAVYMNTVGCYTFPSVGDSDTIFKLDAATGGVVWKRRVNDPEQFGFCAADSAVDCGTDAACAGVGGTCTIPKASYHDFGFLNGPIPLDVPDGMGGQKTLLVSGSKNGTLYAFNETDGTIAWTNVVRPTPVTPGFAGYGLFNAPLAYVDGRLHAALYEMIPRRACDNDSRIPCSSDDACGGGTCLAEPDHLMAFDPTTGAVLWSDDIGRSWSAVAVANGVLVAGTQVRDSTTDASQLFAYDAAAGTRLASFPIPAVSTARPLVAGDTLYVGFGVLGTPGGVRAYSLCGNGILDSGEECDDGNVAAGDCCSPACTFDAMGTSCAADGNACTDAACDGAGTCVQEPNVAGCDDGDPCTRLDACAAGVCRGTVAVVADVVCTLDALRDAPCGAEGLPQGLGRAVSRKVDAARRLLLAAEQAAARGRSVKVERSRARALRQLEAIRRKAEVAAATRKASRRISPGCRDALVGLVGNRRDTIEGFAFTP